MQCWKTVALLEEIVVTVHDEGGILTDQLKDRGKVNGKEANEKDDRKIQREKTKPPYHT